MLKQLICSIKYLRRDKAKAGKQALKRPSKSSELISISLQTTR